MNADGRRAALRTRFVAWCALVGAVLTVLLVAAPASAHSTLVRSDPPDGGTVAVGRSQLSLWFGEPIDSTASRFRLLTESGKVLPVTVSMPTGPVGEFVQLDTSSLQRGILRLEWNAISADDGHPSAGTVTFGAGMRPPPAAGSAGAPPAASEVLLRWVQLATLMLAVGALLAPGLLRRAGDLVPAAPQQALRLGTVAALAALVSTLLAPVISADQSSNLLGGVPTTRWGQLWLVHLVALVGATATYSALTRRGPSPLRVTLTGGCLAIAAAADAAAGHSAELSRSPVVAIAAATLHVLAAGAWVGTLAVLAACLVPVMRRSPDLRRPLLASTWRAFSPVAAVSVGLLAASGLYLAGRQLPGLSSLTGSWYGVAAAGKVVVLALALVMAAGTALIADPRLGRLVTLRSPSTFPIPGAELFPRRVGLELALLGTAVVLAAVMTSEPRPLAAGGSAAHLATATADGLFVSFESVPAGGSSSRLIVRVNAVTRPQPGPVTGVDVLIEDPRRQSSSATLTRIEPGRFETTVAAPSTGRLRVWLAIHRPAVQDAVAGLDWSGTPPSVTGRTRLEAVTTPVAFLGALGTVAGLVILQVRRRSRKPEPLRWSVVSSRQAAAPEHAAVGPEGAGPDA